MKKITLVLFAFLFSLTLFAQEEKAVLAQIKATTEKCMPYTSDFTQAKHFPMMENASISEGKLYFTGEKMSMLYTTPSSDVLTINGNTFYMLSNGRKMKVNTEKNKKVKSLKNTLLNCMSGNISTIATENGAAPSVEKEGDKTIVSLSKPKSKKSSEKRSYHLIKLTYNKTLQLTELYMEEMSGIYNIYQITNTKCTATISETAFNIP